jgi:hypothetical protein
MVRRRRLKDSDDSQNSFRRRLLLWRLQFRWIWASIMARKTASMFVKLLKPAALVAVRPNDPPPPLTRQLASMHPASAAPPCQGGTINRQLGAQIKQPPLVGAERRSLRRNLRSLRFGQSPRVKQLSHDVASKPFAGRRRAKSFLVERCGNCLG